MCDVVLAWTYKIMHDEVVKKDQMSERTKVVARASHDEHWMWLSQCLQNFLKACT